MGIALSLVLIASGAILTWAVSKEPTGLDLDAVGVILMIVGLVSFLLSLLMWRSWWGPGYFRHTAYVDDPRYGADRRVPPPADYGRRRVVEEEHLPPAGPPP